MKKFEVDVVAFMESLLESPNLIKPDSDSERAFEATCSCCKYCENQNSAICSLQGKALQNIYENVCENFEPFKCTKDCAPVGNLCHHFAS